MFQLLTYVFIGIILAWSIENTVAKHFIRGEITYNGPKNLEKDVQVDVSFEDVTLMDVKSQSIASTVISKPKSFPIPYELVYNPWYIDSDRIYAVSAKIMGYDGKLLYINDDQIIVKLTGSSLIKANIPVVKVKPMSTDKTSLMFEQKSCPEIYCLLVCPYNYIQVNGCDTCKCYEPCNPSGKSPICSSDQQCFVDKEPDGTFLARCERLPSSTIYNTNVNQSNVTDNICSFSQLTGTCRGKFERYYYNSETNQCESFTYGGCDGNPNNFKTKAQCEEKCMTEPLN